MLLTRRNIYLKYIGVTVAAVYDLAPIGAIIAGQMASAGPRGPLYGSTGCRGPFFVLTCAQY